MKDDTLFVVDLDGVVFNSKERFKRATKDNGQIDWSVAFDPDLLQLDTLMPESVEAIEQLASRGHIVYLTSRPERLYKATLDQIEECYISGPELICKPTSAQYVKTTKWKAEQVQELAGKYEDVVFY